MRSVLIAAASLATAVFAAPQASKFGALRGRGGACMDDAAAQQVATNFKDLIATYSDALANATVAVNFVDYSSTVNTLINSGCTGPVSLNGPTFSSRAEFEAGQGSQPAIPFEQLNIWHTCDTVIIRWRSAQSPEPVTGNIIIEAVPAPAGSAQPWLIETVYSEFNSGAWLVNLGVFTPTCPPPPPPTKRSLGF